MRVLGRLTRDRKRALALWAAWSLVEAFPAFLSGRLVAEAVDAFLRGASGAGLAWLSGLAVAAVVGAFGTRRAFARLTALVEPFRDELAGVAVRGTLHTAAGRPTHDDPAGVARLTQQVETARDSYAALLMASQSFVVTGVAAVLGLATLAPAAAGLVAVPFAAGCVLFVALLGPLGRRQRTSILAEERLARDVAQVCTGLRDVAACGGEAAAAAMLDTRIDETVRASMAVARMSAVRALAVAVGGWLPVVLILARAPSLIRGGMTTGDLLGAVTYVLGAVHPALQGLVRDVGNTGAWLVVTLTRLGELAVPPGRRRGESPRAGAPRAGGAGGPAVRLRGVTFAYGPQAEPVFQNLDLDLAPGEHLAVVGPSGVGKSTLANLIAGVLTPDRGDVQLAGDSLGELDAVELAERRLLIPQEAYVFSGTLRENLAYLRPEATTAELHDAVSRLGAQGLVLRVGGYHAVLEPARLSAGERQLIALVRAMLSPAPLVILDEATCHLDPGAEERAERTFAERDGTLVVVAHRVSSALRAKHVLVLDGVRPEIGRHDELLERSALYRDLVGHWHGVSEAAVALSPRPSGRAMPVSARAD